MPATVPADPKARTARIRGIVAAARPRITSGRLAECTGYSEGYIRRLLSNHETSDGALDKIEAAVERLTTNEAPSRSHG